MRPEISTNRQRSWRGLFLLLPLLAGCGGDKPPSTLQSLYDEERTLPAVFLDASGTEQVIGPGDRGVWARDGKLYWLALTCANPECPAADRAEPVLFCEPNPTFFAKPDDTVGYGGKPAFKPDKNAGSCPECLKVRNLATETEEDRQQYFRFVQPYVLPETEKRRVELAEARQTRQAELRKRMSRDEN